MKIIKEFSDPEFNKSHYSFSDPIINKSHYPMPYDWTWGLGDDGKLYCKSSIFMDAKEWLAFTDRSISLSLDEMIRIVKEFGHLLPLL
jgi:hypothetical protein